LGFAPSFLSCRARALPKTLAYEDAVAVVLMMHPLAFWRTMSA
jgi:hypothetical protein